MADVYVEAGEVKPGNKFPKDSFPAAKVVAAKALTDLLAKTAGVTSNKPAGKASGVQLNIILTDLIPGTNTLTCKLFAELFELPSKDRLTSDVRPVGENKASGQKADVLLAQCVAGAVSSMFTKVLPTLTATAAKPAASNLIYIAPFDVTYPTDAKKAPQGIAADAVKAMTAAVDKKVKANTRFVQTGYQSGMPAYTMRIAVAEVTVDTAKRIVAIRFKGSVDTYPGDGMFILGAPANAKIMGDTSDAGIVETVAGLAGDSAKAMLDTIVAKN